MSPEVPAPEVEPPQGPDEARAAPGPVPGGALHPPHAEARPRDEGTRPLPDRTTTGAAADLPGWQERLAQMLASGPDRGGDPLSGVSEVIAAFRRAQEATRAYWMSRLAEMIADGRRPDPPVAPALDSTSVSSSVGEGEAASVTASLNRGCGPQAPVSRLGENETIGEFRLLAFLGRGCRGEVHLAVQSWLADRPVVLKIVPLHGREHLSLARLQHPHIMPLYGVQDLEERGLRVMCMPFLGGATLAQLLALLNETPMRRRSGRDLVAGLDQVAAQSPITLPACGPARQFLLQSSYERAVCWIGICLAEALQHAHELGIVHLDLKPSNVLIAADGRPILLDFHLAREVIRPGEAAEPIGGTPLYMSPEQAIALQDARCARACSVLVDGRSDLYSLGAMLLQMLDGTIPLRSSARAIRRRIRAPRRMAAILARCLAEAPEARYPDAVSLAADLRRCLAELPAPIPLKVEEYFL